MVVVMVTMMMVLVSVVSSRGIKFEKVGKKRHVDCRIGK